MASFAVAKRQIAAKLRLIVHGISINITTRGMNNRGDDFRSMRAKICGDKWCQLGAGGTRAHTTFTFISGV
ncbi:MAG: hypothetical protein JSR47_02455 [Proteobacteria bacterium]|nr:hypothetical protein [Pseudomonadota bacterium]